MPFYYLIIALNKLVNYNFNNVFVHFQELEKPEKNDE